MIKLLLLLVAGLKWGKLATTGGTMLLSLAVYASIWGLPYAAGFIALLFLHEMGHYVAARQRGLDVGAPTFIPFVGAWIALKGLPHDVETEAYVAMVEENEIRLGLGQFGQFQVVGELAVDIGQGGHAGVERVALLHDLLGLVRVVPEVVGFGEGVQLGEALDGDIPVKDASSGARPTP